METRPDAMNRMLIGAHHAVYLVRPRWVPSTSGSKSRCHTLARNVGALHFPGGWAILSISSKKHDAVLLDVGERLGLDVRRRNRSFCRFFRRSGTLSASVTRHLGDPLRCPRTAEFAGTMPWSWLVRSSMPGGAMISILRRRAGATPRFSTSRSSKLGLRAASCGISAASDESGPAAGRGNSTSRARPATSTSRMRLLGGVRPARIAPPCALRLRASA